MITITRWTLIRQALEEKANKALADLEASEKARKELEAAYAKLTTEKGELMNRLQAESGTVADFHEKQNKLMAQKGDLESQLSVRILRTFAILEINPSICTFTVQWWWMGPKF